MSSPASRMYRVRSASPVEVERTVDVRLPPLRRQERSLRHQEQVFLGHGRRGPELAVEDSSLHHVRPR